MLGREGWEPRPVIFDEFYADPETGELGGLIEVVESRWGASLGINPKPPEEDEDEEAAETQRSVPLLLYDLWNDPMALWSLHEERPDLVQEVHRLPGGAVRGPPGPVAVLYAIR